MGEYAESQEYQSFRSNIPQRKVSPAFVLTICITIITICTGLSLFILILLFLLFLCLIYQHPHLLISHFITLAVIFISLEVILFIQKSFYFISSHFIGSHFMSLEVFRLD